jgi:uncharacterized Zn finger protein
MAQPKCPACGVEGVEKVASTDSKERDGAGDPWFFVVYCDNCGHVYGVFAKMVHTSERGLPAIPTPPLGPR